MKHYLDVVSMKEKTKMKRFYLLLAFASLLGACQPAGPKWIFDKSIDIKGIAPIGIAVEGDHFWVSDGDNSRLLKLSQEGEVLVEENEFERPMHIAVDGGKVYIPSYGDDAIIEYKDGNRIILPIKDSLDAPAGVDVKGKEMAIADFYNHRILYTDGTNWIKVGEKGNGDLEFHYPTDVQLVGDKIYVADAYNNRIQIIDKKGQHIKNIGKEEKMNAATGIYVDKEDIYITDFEHDRVLVYNNDGDLLAEINEGLSKPTDLLINNDKLIIINYKSQSISVFKK